MRFIKKFPLLNTIYHAAVSYPVPININYFWNFGVLALVCLIIQIITGIFLAMHYVAHADLAFISVEHIMRDVNYGWLIRYIHANGASMFFLVVYVHIFRGLYYSSYTYPRQILWCIGVIILLVMILTAFMGYVLPWGQMSFWAATVITNLASAIPVIGENIVLWLWGGYSVDNPTLNRFFSLHYLFPFLLLGLVGLHLIFLHENLSNNPIGSDTHVERTVFGPYFIIKDLYGIILFFIFFSYFLFFNPNLLGHTDNYIPANAMVTPTHIVPEWYFLPFYAILRSVPDKLGGVILLLAAIIILLLMPFFIIHNERRSYLFKTLHKIFFWFFLVNCLILGWIGGKSIETPFYEIGQYSTMFYFGYFTIILPWLSYIEYLYWVWKDYKQ